MPANPGTESVPKGEQQDETNDKTWPDSHEGTEDEEADEARGGER
jgi:hypothetical protein